MTLVPVYAKFDPKFRKTLKCYAPFIDNYVKFVFQEEKPYLDSIVDSMYCAKEWILDRTFGKDKVRNECDTTVCGNEHPDADKCAENGNGNEEKVVNNIADQPSVEKNNDDEKTCEQVGADINLFAEQIKTNYEEASLIIKEYSNNSYENIRNAITNLDNNVWGILKDLEKEKNKKYVEIQEQIMNKMKALGQRQTALSSQDLKCTPEERNTAKETLRAALETIRQAKAKLEDELKNLAVYENYRNKVQSRWNQTMEEFESIFPHATLSKDNLKLTNADFDLFLLYSFEALQNIRKNIERLNCSASERINKVVSDNKDKIKRLTNEKYKEESAKLQSDYNQKIKAIYEGCNARVEEQLRAQEALHDVQLREIVENAQMTASSKISEELTALETMENHKMNTELKKMEDRFRQVMQTLKVQAEDQKKMFASQPLWAAGQSMLNAIDKPASTLTGHSVVHVDDEISAIKKAAEGDETVEAIINWIPEDAMKWGVSTSVELKDRFDKLSAVAAHVAQVPEDKVSLLRLGLSYLISKFVVLNGETDGQDVPVDAGTYNLLKHAKYWVDRNDMSKAVPYVERIRGLSRNVSQQWVDEVRKYLAIKHAAHALMTYASVTSLSFVEHRKDNNSKV
ncbi:MICOS complex subunit Mic60-like [Adelges cooleyi]|uniref:MICOS complex subunit Mic60-like n=1 Tax=Adelges cooleyi TaxID=133065 RepID=UPI00218075A2|nr:MICOS complex subunit Mic60-like [Adelges cooleyi]